METWKLVPDNPDYMVSDLGRVRSLARVIVNCNGKSQKIRERILKRQIATNGYEVVSLRLNREKTPPRTIHSLIMEAFVGPRPAGMVARHGDGNRLNSVLSNLCYGTWAENMQDAVVHGTTTAGERNFMSKLTDVGVLEIRRRCALGETDTSIALDFDVSRPTVTYIRQRKTWAHV